MKYTLEDTESPTKRKRLGTSTVREGLESSRAVFARLLEPGDLIDGKPITDRIEDEDGTLVLACADGSFYEVPPR